jgi:hypothetical protein
MQKMEMMKEATREYGFLMGLYFLSSCIQAFPMVSIAAILNLDLMLSPSELALYYASIFIPWNLRAIYGLTSDAIPILGYRRKPYMICGYVGTCVCYLCYGLFVGTITDAFVIGIIMNVFFSLSEAVLDASAIDKLRSRSCATGSDETSHIR